MAGFVAEASASPLPPRFAGRLTDGEDDPGGLELPPWLGQVSDLSRVLHQETVDRVIFFPPCNRPDAAPEVLDACRTVGAAADFAIDLQAAGGGAPRVFERYGRPFISLEGGHRPAEALALKQLMDIAIALLALLLLSPVILLVCLAILLTMGRPLLFVQRRSGLNGRTFSMLKFRTMIPGAEKDRDRLAAHGNEMSGPVFKLKEDPRVTPLGRLLRSTSLDELPQLINVLRGEMSLVGPRPLPTAEQEQIRGWQRRRLSMKPGITGIWQVSGRNAVDFEDWMRMDLEYVDSWSLALDLRLLLQTIPAVLSRRGAR